MSGVNVIAWIVLLISADALGQENACQSKPCQNGGVCVTNRGDYTCHCSKEPQNGHLYGGPNCTVVLLGCERHRCQNGATCSPFLNSGRQRYTCSCSEGFTGARCEITTTFSFDKSGFLHLQTELEDRAELLNATLSFRTVQPTATLLQCRVDDNILTVQLQNGRLGHLLERAQQSVFVELLQDVADAHWHTVQVLLHGNVLGLRLLDPSCTARTCHKEELVETEPGSGLDLSDFTLIQSVYIGGTGHGQANPESYFLGCMRDVHVQSYVVVPGSIVQAEQVNVSLGCRESDSCEETPCKNRGKCISLGWRKHTCECHRPYEGQTCSEEYIAARFGGDDSESYTVFSVDGEPRDSFTASMFVRTRSSNGLLLVISNRTSHYLSVWLEDGKVHVQASHSERLRGYESVNNGDFHLVSVEVRPGSLTLSQSARAQASTKAQGLTIRAGDRVYVGGLEEQDASSAFRSYFKGCIQDLRINSWRLQFYPLSTPVSSYSLERMVEVTRGCTADNSCRKNPCLNGGVCYSVWDDFTCSCPPNTAGRRCEEVKWCELSPCPPLAACRSHAQGFDCIAPITLRKGNPIITFRGNGRIRRSLRSVALTFRTRSSDATLLYASREAEFISISVLNRRLVVELQSGSSFLQMQSRRAVVSDGHWHSAVLTKDGPSAATSGWSMVLDERQDEASVSSTVFGGLDFLREGVDILLGGFELSSGADWDGCLGSVEIGGLVLPYYTEGELNVARSQEERFSITSGTRNLGCWGSKVCDPNPCQNGGRCEDLFDLFKCSCPENWRGQRCEVDANPCASNPCVHGACVASLEGYECVCQVGYTGPWCASEEDICAGHKCRNGGTCLRGYKRYACLCPRNTTGAHCQERVPELPWYVDRIPYPKLPVSVCGNEKWNYSCFNGGNCSVHQDTCDCLPGFTGQWCELEVDECASDPCLNGGFCRNLINKFQCVCEISFAGDHCQIDVSDFYLYVFLLMWQNIFQLLSYLILRLDDEPEIEWNAANDE